jgi:hypothetical protein
MSEGLNQSDVTRFSGFWMISLPDDATQTSSTEEIKLYDAAINETLSLSNKSGYEVETDSNEEDDESNGGVLHSLLLEWTNLLPGTDDDA